MLAKQHMKGLVVAFALSIYGVHAAKGQLQQVSGNIGPNPTNVAMWIYKPSNLTTPTPLIVALHNCGGSAQSFFSGTRYADRADTKGYMVVYPSTPSGRGTTCFDVASNATLTHDAGGDSQGVASMIKYSIANYGIDPKKVFVAGLSSGAMMTNVMAGSYPDLFQAASIWAGVPFSCFAGPTFWNDQCSAGRISKTASQWGDIVRNAYPGYTGPRPKMQIWHGSSDTTLSYPNFAEEIKQWTNVLNVSSTATLTTKGKPSSQFTQTVYGDAANPLVVAYSGQGITHDITVNVDADLAWFGI